MFLSIYERTACYAVGLVKYNTLFSVVCVRDRVFMCTCHASVAVEVRCSLREAHSICEITTRCYHNYKVQQMTLPIYLLTQNTKDNVPKCGWRQDTGSWQIFVYLKALWEDVSSVVQYIHVEIFGNQWNRWLAVREIEDSRMMWFVNFRNPRRQF